MNLFIARHAEAKTFLGPIMNFEVYRRTTPEERTNSRIGLGFLASLPTLNDILFTDIKLSWMSNTDTFASGNSYEYREYRAGIGPLWKIFDSHSIRFNFRTGATYFMTFFKYRQKLSGFEQILKPYYWVPYAAIEGIVTPTTGIGVREGLEFQYDPHLKGTIYTLYLGITL